MTMRLVSRFVFVPCVWLLVVLVGVSEARGSDRTLVVNHDFKFSMQVSPTWKQYMENHDANSLMIVYTLPGIWSETEGRNISNAISITICHFPEVHNLESLISFHRKMSEINGIVELTRDEVNVETGRAYTVTVDNGGNKFKCRYVYHYGNGMGYYLTFVATEGTFDKNLHQFMDFLATFQIEPDYQSGAIKTDNGYLLVLNKPNGALTLRIVGDNVSPDPKIPYLFTVDGKIIQALTVPISSFSQEVGLQSTDRKSILEAHRDWEFRRKKQEMGDDSLELKSSWMKLPTGVDVLIWDNSLPKTNTGNVTRQLALETVVDDQVVALSSVTTAGIKREAVVDLLVRTLLSLETKPKPIDLNKLSDQTIKESKNYPGTPDHN